MVYRRFSDALEKTAEEWAEMTTSFDEWVNIGPYGCSESRPFQVERTRDGLVGLAKPGVVKMDRIPRAAHEKIASDLAYHLDLPVPPVVLWDRGESEPARYVCISAWTFATQPFTWHQAKNFLTDDEKEDARRIVSGMLAFEAWIAADDRKADHVLVNIDSSNRKLQFAFIDYAYSMSKNWGETLVQHRPIRSYLQELTIDNGAVEEITQRILSLKPELINGLVDRIPDQYLGSDQRAAMRTNLQHVAA